MPATIIFQPGRYYVMDGFARTWQAAYVSGPFFTFEAADRDRLERNIADDCDVYLAPVAPRAR